MIRFIAVTLPFFIQACATPEERQVRERTKMMQILSDLKRDHAAMKDEMTKLESLIKAYEQALYSKGLGKTQTKDPQPLNKVTKPVVDEHMVKLSSRQKQQMKDRLARLDRVNYLGNEISTSLHKQ